MKKVYIQTRTAPNGRCAYDLLNINGGFVGGSPADYATPGEAYEVALTHVQNFPESFTLITPAMVADVVSSTLHYLYDLKSFQQGYNKPTSAGLEEWILKIEKLLEI